MEILNAMNPEWFLAALTGPMYKTNAQKLLETAVIHYTGKIIEDSSARSINLLFLSNVTPTATNQLLWIMRADSRVGLHYSYLQWYFIFHYLA